MGRRWEEKVDEELLARLESGDDKEKIRVKLPKTRINEMFAIADQILGGRRVRVVCADGETRLARIPGKMRRRQWVREGDLIIIQPWDFQDSKADVRMRYTKTQSLYLSRKGVLPDIVDIFGLGDDYSDADDDGGIWASPNASEPEPEPDSEPESESDAAESDAAESDAAESDESDQDADSTSED
jgi:translation initiation factor 1A